MKDPQKSENLNFLKINIQNFGAMTMKLKFSSLKKIVKFVEKRKRNNNWIKKFFNYSI